MIKVLKHWIDDYFSDPQAILLLVLLVAGFGIIIFFGNIFMPVFVSIAIAFFLQYWVSFLQKNKCPFVVAYWIVFLAFMLVFAASLIWLLPMLWKQCTSLMVEFPDLVQNTKTLLYKFLYSHNDYISAEYMDTVVAAASEQSEQWVKKILTSSFLSTIPSIIAWIVYIILVPMLVFFFLRDKDLIMNWFASFLPAKRSVITQVWREMNMQISNYIRGKITEILIVGFFTYLVFFFFDLRYQVLLGVLVGLSVVIPYIGAVVVTIPVILVGYLQWGFVGGFTGEFALMFYSYLFVQFVDSSIIVPLLFSEAVNLHPVAIIIAILFFGAIWGFWGVFFAIPLATLIKAVINAWPKKKARLQHA